MPRRFSPPWRFRRHQAATWKTRVLALQQALPDLLVRISADGTYLDVHAPQAEDLAAPLEALIGRRVPDVLPPDVAEKYMSAAGRVLATGELVEYEYELDVPSGRQVFDARLVQSGPDEVTSIIRNVTERRRLQQQSEQRRVELALERERRQILERFIQDASHDLRTPITAITSTGYLLEKYVEQLKQQLMEMGETFRAGRDYTPLIGGFVDTLQRLTERQQMMTIAGHRLKTLVDAMFDIIRLDVQLNPPMKPEPLLSIAEVVLDLLKPEAERRGIEVCIEAPAPPTTVCNAELIQRALQNLVTNALNYTLDGGQVTIRLGSAPPHATIEVVDTGIGIAPEHLTSIFRRFYRVDDSRTSRTGGSGLGLAIVQRIVELHGGRVDVESTPAQGSTFRIALPLHGVA